MSTGSKQPKTQMTSLKELKLRKIQTSSLVKIADIFIHNLNNHQELAQHHLQEIKNSYISYQRQDQNMYNILQMNKSFTEIKGSTFSEYCSSIKEKQQQEIKRKQFDMIENQKIRQQRKDRALQQRTTKIQNIQKEMQQKKNFLLKCLLLFLGVLVVFQIKLQFQVSSQFLNLVVPQPNSSVICNNSCSQNISQNPGTNQTNSSNDYFNQCLFPVIQDKMITVLKIVITKEDSYIHQWVLITFLVCLELTIIYSFISIIWLCYKNSGLSIQDYDEGI